jgi:uncharacterized protein YprB with RNaseH-like and TPR domain
MSGLRERMNRLRGQASAPELASQEAAEENAAEIAPPPEAEEQTSGLSQAWTAMDVIIRENEQGSYLLRRVLYPLEHVHGHHRLGQLTETAAALSALHADSTEQPGAERLLFLDLETTGLGVGAGNVPFMVGLAFIEGSSFVVEQALIRHPAEERAMLFDLKDKLVRFPYMVTYNGRTFDWPVLAGRYIMNGFGRLQYEPKHLDFLHPSRSIWRNTLTSCKLSHVEEERLGIKRSEDVPGSLAPAIYFQFLADGNPAPLEGVFRHNEWDMLALACLAVRFGSLLDGRLGKDIPMPEHSEELLRTGLWLERMGRGQLAEPLFLLLTERPDTSAGWCLPLAARDKKYGNWDRAVVLWQKAAAAAENSVLPTGEAHIELAMYHEHKVKDYTAALRYAESALELALRRMGIHRHDPKRRAELDAIRKRTERLRKKIGRS